VSLAKCYLNWLVMKDDKDIGDFWHNFQFEYLLSKGMLFVYFDSKIFDGKVVLGSPRVKSGNIVFAGYWSSSNSLLGMVWEDSGIGFI